MFELSVLAIAGAIGLAVHVVLSNAEEKSVVRSSLRQLDGYEVENVRDQELLTPLRQRALLPLLNGMVGLGRRFTPVGYVDGIREKFIHAGRGTVDTVDRFLAVRVATVAAIPLMFILAFFVLPLSGMLAVGVFMLGGLGLLLGPDAIINRRVVDRQTDLLRQLPDVLDLLTISVEAGLGFEQAVDRAVAAVPGALSNEFSRMLGEVRAGASRADAMRALDQRTDVPELRSFVLAVLQADTFGVSIGRVLRAQADEMRIKRRQIAEEKAQKAPVKMLIPMVFCIFPSIFVIILGPAAISISRNL